MPKARTKTEIRESLEAGQSVERLNDEIRRLRKQLAEQANPEFDRRLMKLQSENSRLKGAANILHDRVDELLKREKLFDALSSPGDVEKWRTKRKSRGNASAIAVLSDWHVEETIEADKVNYKNKFDLVIAEARIKRTFQKIIYLLENARQLAKIDELVLYLGGDFITGYIHEELEESNGLSPLEACRWVQDHLLSGIAFLEAHSGCSIVIPTSYGNHGRTTKKKRVSTAAENSYEYDMYCQMERMLKGSTKSKLKIERGYHNILEVQKHVVRFHHGDALKYGGGVGGITIPVNKAIAQWNNSIRADLDVFGHFHQFTVGNRRWVCNGSLIGYSPYAVSIKAECEPPMQSFILMDREYGNVMTLPIFCEEASGESQATSPVL